MILLWGVPGDAPLDRIHAALQNRGTAVRLLDQRGASSTRAALRTDGDGWVTGKVTDATGEINLDDVNAAYIRPIDTGTACPSVSKDDAVFLAAVAADNALVNWANLADAHVVNRPQAMAANNSKPFQLAQIARFGFAVPETLVTTDEAAVRRFCRRHPHVIFKSVSGTRSIVAPLTDPEDTLADVANCPTQFQEYIPGVDVRVHVAGQRIVATKIVSAAHDYRYAARSGNEVRMTPTDLPTTIAESCVAMTRGMDLYLSGIDLRYTPAGEWYCFEVNPSPGFTFFEAATNQPIESAIADLLIELDHARPCRRTESGPNGAPCSAPRPQEAPGLR